MKSRALLVIGVLLASLLSGCSKQQAHGVVSSSDSMLIEPGVSIGPVHSGMTTKQVIAKLGVPVKVRDGILMYRNLSVFLAQDGLVGHVFYFEPSTNRPFTEVITAHTKEGIGIGSSRDEVISAYGEPTATKYENVHKENEVLVYEPLHLQFHIRNGRVYLIAVYFKK